MFKRSLRWLILLLIAVGLIMPATVTVAPKCGYTADEAPAGDKEKPAKKKGKKSKKGDEKKDGGEAAK
jgi:hypothetical protein